MKKGTGVLAGMRFAHRLLKLTLTPAVTLGVLLILNACNTMHGLGQDVEQAGEAIQKSAK